MDPSIMKLLEEDEDESMHSGAEVDAFQAALNRDLGVGGVDEATGSGGGVGVGVDLSQLQSSDSSSGVLPQGGCSSSTQSFQQWPASNKDGKPEAQSQEDIKSELQDEQNLSQMQSNQHRSDTKKQQESNVSYHLQQNQSQEKLQQRQGQQISTHIARTSEMQTQQNSISVREPGRAQNPDSESQYIKLQRMSNQQDTVTEQVNNAMNKSKQVPFALLLPGIMPHLDKDRAMQVQTLFIKLKKNEIPKDLFVRNMRAIVGDEMLRLAVMKLQPQQISSGHSSQPTQQQPASTPPAIANTAQSNNYQSFPQLQKSNSASANSSYIASSSLPVKTSSTHPTAENNAKVTREMEWQSDSKGIPLSQMSSSISSAKEQSSVPLQGHDKQQQHYHFPRTSVPMSEGSTSSSYYSYAGPNVNPSSSTLKLQSHESQMRQTPLHHGVRSPQVGGATHAMNVMNVSRYEKPGSMSDPNRLHGVSQAHFSKNSALQPSAIQHSGPLSSVNSIKQELVDQSNEKQNKSHLPTPHGLPSFSSSQEASPSILPYNSASSSMTSQLDPNAQLGSRKTPAASPAGINARAMPSKPAIGQKKPLEAAGSSPPPSSKKQKVSGAFLDQSIDQLNDVTAVSGVNLREEEEQLFSGSKEDSRASEAIRRVVQEEEEKLILQKIPLQKKLAEIMAKFGLNSLSNEVERCLSLSVEDRLRGLICNVIRASKQRVDVEKPRHRTIITSDVRRQIMSINKKAREEWEKRQTEADKLRRLNDPESNNGIDGEKDNDEPRVKSNKANKEEDEKMRATAANVAARAAVGGDDMLSKWQLMAEQNRQKREGGSDAASGFHNRNTSSSKNIRGNQEAKKRGHAASVTASGSMRKFGRNVVPQPRVARTISVKDVITVLEREPQMSKSTLLYRLYDRIPSYAVAE